MKKIIIVLTMFIITSCEPSFINPYVDAPTQFIVMDTLTKGGMSKMTTYYIEVIDANNLAYGTNGKNLKFWFCDSVGKYKIGQSIHFDN